MKKLLLSIMLATSMFVSAQNIEQIKASVKQSYITACKEINSQLPIEIDDFTTLTSVVFANWTMTCSYRVNADFSSFSSEELKELMTEQRNETLENAKRMLMTGNYASEKQMREFMKITGMKMRMTYRDENGLFIGSILYDYKDFGNPSVR